MLHASNFKRKDEKEEEEEEKKKIGTLTSNVFQLYPRIVYLYVNRM